MPVHSIRELIKKQSVFTAPVSATVRSVSHVMKANKISSIMVVDDDKRLVGIFTERDALYRVVSGGLDPNKVTIGQAMTANPSAIDPDCRVETALHTMQDLGVRHMPVVENGRPVGMFSIRDAIGMELSRIEDEAQKKQVIAEIIG